MAVLKDFLGLWENRPVEWEDHDEPWCTLEEFRGSEDALDLTLLVSYLYSEGVPKEEWVLQCDGVKAHKLPAQGGIATLSDDHPLLWPHTEPLLDLYFQPSGRESHRSDRSIVAGSSRDDELRSSFPYIR